MCTGASDAAARLPAVTGAPRPPEQCAQPRDRTGGPAYGRIVMMTAGCVKLVCMPFAVGGYDDLWLRTRVTAGGW